MDVTEIRGRELVALAMYRLGAKGPTDLADKIGMGERRAPEKISRWLGGENEPSYPATLLLLKGAKLLRENGSDRRLADDLQEALESERLRVQRVSAQLEGELAPARPQRVRREGS